MKNTTDIALNQMSRAIRKPLMEKRRRARMNDSLDILKQILIDCSDKTVKFPGTVSKLDKADILEMTVQFLQELLRSEKPSEQNLTPWRPW